MTCIWKRFEWLTIWCVSGYIKRI